MFRLAHTFSLHHSVTHSPGYTDRWALCKRPSRLGDCPGLDRCSLSAEPRSSSPYSQPAWTCTTNINTAQIEKKKRQSLVINSRHIPDEYTHTQTQSTGPNFLALILLESCCQLWPASDRENICNICFQAATTGALNSNQVSLSMPQHQQHTEFTVLIFTACTINVMVEYLCTDETIIYLLVAASMLILDITTDSQPHFSHEPKELIKIVCFISKCLW